MYWKQLTGLDAIELIGWRVGTAGVVMAVVVSVLGRWPRVRSALADRTVLGPLLLASLLLTVNWTTYVWAVTSGRVIETALGYFLAPLGTMALGVVVLGERLTPLKQASVACAGVAVVVLMVSYGRLPWVALVLASTWAWYGLTKRHVPLDPIESLSSELFVLFVPAAALVAAGWFRTDSIPSQATASDWGFLLGTGAITAIPLLLFAFAAQRVPFTVLGPTNYLVPLINFLLGWLVYDESLPPSRVVGFGLVWIALVLVTIDTISARWAAVAPRLGFCALTNNPTQHLRLRHSALMRTRFLAIITASTLALSACGGGGGGSQGEVADLLIKVAEDEGFVLDRDCVEKAAEGLTDDDAQAIVDAGVDGEPAISDDAQAVGADIINCVSVDSYIDKIVAGFEEDESFDGDCFRDQIEGLDSIEAIDEVFFDIALSCSSNG